jgi:hypothetical protein
LVSQEYFDELRCLVPGGKDTKNDRNRVLALAIDHLKVPFTQPGYLRSTPAHECWRGSWQFLRGNAGTVKQEAHDERERTPLMFEMDGMDGDHKELEAKVDQVEGKEEKRLSHNEVEQRRRREAKQHYEELRRHIPNSAKFDKNTVLMAVIAQIKQLAGITDAAMARMLSEFAAGHNEAEGDASAAPSAPTSGCNVFGASAPKSKLSESPSDVTVLHAWGAALPGKEPAPSAAAALAMGLGVDAGCKRPREAAMATPTAAHDVHKRLRSEEGAPASRAAAHGSAPDSGAGMDALSMLSQAAVKVASAPSTPIHGPLGPGKFADLHSHLPTLSELSAPAMVRSEARPCEAGSETCSGSKAPSAG